MIAPFKILPILVCRKGQVDENFMNKKEKQLRENLKIQTEVLGHVVINEEGDIPTVKEQLAKADVIILFKPHLGLGDCTTKISGYSSM